MILNEVLLNTFKRWQFFVHAPELFVGLTPFKVTKPISWIWRNINCACRTGEEESPFILIHFVIAKEDFDAKDQREEELMLFEEGSADILVESMCEEIVQVIDSLLSISSFRFWRIVNGRSEKSSKPLQ